MVIGSDFSDKSKLVLREIGRNSDDDVNKKISVEQVNKDINLDRTEIKNFLEYLQDLEYIEIVTIGGPLLYGHVKITEEGLKKYAEIKE